MPLKESCIKNEMTKTDYKGKWADLGVEPKREGERESPGFHS
jgi:hypothetical protein